MQEEFDKFGECQVANVTVTTDRTYLFAGLLSQ